MLKPVPNSTLPVVSNFGKQAFKLTINIRDSKEVVDLTTDKKYKTDNGSFTCNIMREAAVLFQIRFP